MLRESRERPPSFSELLSEVRSEEEYASFCMKLNSSVRQVQVNADPDCREGKIHSLKCNIKELKAMVTAMTATNSQATASKKDVLMDNGLLTEACVDPDIIALKKQVSKLQNQVIPTKQRIHDASAAASKIEPARFQNESRQQTSVSDGNLCYRCGDIGHYFAKCRNTENQSKVIPKLIRSLKKA